MTIKMHIKSSHKGDQVSDQRKGQFPRVHAEDIPLSVEVLRPVSDNDSPKQELGDEPAQDTNM